MASAMRSEQSYSIDLPPNFRVHDVLAFHARDAMQVAERVSESSLEKGVSWNGQAARLQIAFEPGRAKIDLSVDGAAASRPDAEATLIGTVRRMLGLAQPIELFEETYGAHPQLGPLLARQSGLRVPLAASPFEALSWAVCGQQISLAAAISIRRNLIRLAGPRHSSGLACFPDAGQIVNLSEQDLRRAGFSLAKARTLLALSREVADGRLPLDAWKTSLPVEEIRARCLQVRGIGPWTVDYALLRGYGWLDGSLHGDAGVRRKLRSLLGSAEKLSQDETKLWLAEFSPWRALVAVHLWTMPA